MTTFAWRGQRLELFDHPYNGTRTNERAVELPVAFEFLRRVAVPGSVGLEVGNVLGHYVDEPQRRVVDRFEVARGVENLDLFEVRGSFDWIVSISTIEHVRVPENPWGPVAALMYLRGLLRAGGRMLVTAGVDQAPGLDHFLRCQTVARTVVRTAKGWRATPTPLMRPYGPEHGARSVWIYEWSNP